MTPKKTARQYVGAWVLSHSGQGTMTDPQMIEQTGRWMAPECFARLKYGLESAEDAPPEQGSLAV